jgi:glycine hydroxymethyltransferase
LAILITAMPPSPLQPIQALSAAHRNYRAGTLNLIASENAMSPWAERMIDPSLGHRYGDYTGTDPTAREYTGNRHLTGIDLAARNAIQELFGCRHADLRPLSGHVAGISVLLSMCRAGDTVFELPGFCGGHELAARLSQSPLCPLNVQPLPFDAANYNLDVEGCITAIRAQRPRVVILGSSLFLFPHPIAPIAQAVAEVGGLLQFDASHVLGLIAAGLFPQPLREGAHVISSSTHKTFAGPQGGLIMADDDQVFQRVVGSVYPSIVDNHHLHRLPALTAVAQEWREFGREHAAAIVANARALGAALDDAGVAMVGKALGYTTSHTLLIIDANANETALRLESAGIMTTPIGLPPELGAGCLRIGVQEITRRGFRIADAPAVAGLIAGQLRRETSVEQTAAQVASLVANWQEWRFTWPLEEQP